VICAVPGDNREHLSSRVHRRDCGSIERQVSVGLVTSTPPTSRASMVICCCWPAWQEYRRRNGLDLGRGTGRAARVSTPLLLSQAPAPGLSKAMRPARLAAGWYA
jgi:hypothetical protein